MLKSLMHTIQHTQKKDTHTHLLPFFFIWRLWYNVLNLTRSFFGHDHIHHIISIKMKRPNLLYMNRDTALCIIIQQKHVRNNWTCIWSSFYFIFSSLLSSRGLPLGCHFKSLWIHTIFESLPFALPLSLSL